MLLNKYQIILFNNTHICSLLIKIIALYILVNKFVVFWKNNNRTIKLTKDN